MIFFISGTNFSIQNAHIRSVTSFQYSLFQTEASTEEAPIIGVSLFFFCLSDKLSLLVCLTVLLFKRLFVRVFLLFF